MIGQQKTDQCTDNEPAFSETEKIAARDVVDSFGCSGTILATVEPPCGLHWVRRSEGFIQRQARCSKSFPNISLQSAPEEVEETRSEKDETGQSL